MGDYLEPVRMKRKGHVLMESVPDQLLGVDGQGNGLVWRIGTREPGCLFRIT